MNKDIKTAARSLKMLGLLVPMVLAMSSVANDYDDDQVMEESKPAPKSFYKRLENFYVFGNSGVSNAISSKSVHFSPEYTGGGGIGYYFHDLLRADFNVSYRKEEVRIKNRSTSDFKGASNISYMWNLYLNLTDKEDRFVPYLTAGLGYGTNKLNQNSYTDGLLTYTPSGSKSGFVWNTGVGGLLRVTNNVFMDVYYRYIDLGKVTGNTTVTGVGSPKVYPLSRDLQAHELGLGIMIRL